MYTTDIPISVKEFLMFKSSVNMKEALESVGLWSKNSRTSHSGSFPEASCKGC